MNFNLSSTKWNRCFIHDRHMMSVRRERCRFLNDYDQLGPLPLAKGISKTCFPDGSVKQYTR